MRICTEWAEESCQECIESADQGYNACSQTEDQGYNSCADWDANCCDWWPCSWGCRIVSWVCVAWTWVSNVICVAWTWISNVVCVTWTTVVTLACIAWTVVEVLLTPAAVLLELIQSIPVVGRLVDEILNVVQEVGARLVGIGDALLGLVGVRPLKKMRICIIVLRDREGAVSDQGTLQPFIDEARRVFRDEANIHLVVDRITTVDGPSPGYVLDVGCNADAWGEDLWLPGTFFQAIMAWHCLEGATGRVLGIRPTIVVFCVRGIPGNTAGCALGPLTDYLTIEGRNPLCLAHEIGHKVGLWHCCSGANLANGTCGGTNLEAWQVLIARNSKYVTYL